MSWLSKNAGNVEAIAAAVTALVAVAALIGVKYQLDAADKVQRAQSAREAYRSHLALSVSHPSYSLPADACGLMNGNEAGAYSSFVDHLLYSAEQMLDLEPGWEPTFMEALEPHAAYICNANGPHGDTEQMEALLDRFKASNCSTAKQCE